MRLNTVFVRNVFKTSEFSIECNGWDFSVNEKITAKVIHDCTFLSMIGGLLFEFWLDHLLGDQTFFCHFIRTKIPVSWAMCFSSVSYIFPKHHSFFPIFFCSIQVNHRLHWIFSSFCTDIVGKTWTLVYTKNVNIDLRNRICLCFSKFYWINLQIFTQYLPNRNYYRSVVVCCSQKRAPHIRLNTIF